MCDERQLNILSFCGRRYDDSIFSKPNSIQYDTNEKRRLERNIDSSSMLSKSKIRMYMKQNVSVNVVYV